MPILSSITSPLGPLLSLPTIVYFALVKCIVKPILDVFLCRKSYAFFNALRSIPWRSM